MKTGWIGLGKMGIPMAQSLLKQGYELSVFNRSREKENILKEQGASSANSPKELLEEAEVVFVVVSDDDAVRAVFEGDKGLLASKVQNRLVVNMSTVSAEISREMAEKLQKQGNDYLDAPVSGSVKQANEASLVIMAGGKKDIYEKLKPLLETIGKKAIYMGDTGAGNLAKLAVNTYLGIVTQGLAEIIRFSGKKGLATKDLLEIMNNSALGSPYLKIKGEAVLQENFNAAFTLSHLTKDLRLARDAGMEFPLSRIACQSFSEAESELGAEDVISIIKKL